MNTNNKPSGNPQIPKNSKNSPSYSKKSVISSLSDVCGGGGVRYSTVKAKAKTPFPLSVIICAFAATVLFMFIVFSFVQVAELSSEISKMKSDINALSGEAATLEGQIDYRYTKSGIEKISSELGLTPSQNTTVYFAGENSEDVSEIIEPETQLDETINTLLGAISKNFRKLIDFMN